MQRLAPGRMGFDGGVAKLKEITEPALNDPGGRYIAGERFELHERRLRSGYESAGRASGGVFIDFLNTLHRYEDTPQFILSILRMHSENCLAELTGVLKDPELIRAVGQFGASKGIPITASNIIFNSSNFSTANGIAKVAIRAAMDGSGAMMVLTNMTDVMNSEPYRNMVPRLVWDGPLLGQSAELVVRIAVSGDRSVAEDIDKMLSMSWYSREFVDAFLHSVKGSLPGSNLDVAASRRADDPEGALLEGRKMIDGINAQMLGLLQRGLHVNDPEMLDLLRERAKIARTIGKAKRVLGMGIVDREREARSEESFLQRAVERGIDRDYAERMIRLAMISGRLVQWYEKVPL